MRTKLSILFLVLAIGIAPLVAAPISFYGNLSGPNESPANASPGTGTAVVTIDSLTHTLTLNVSFFGLLGTTTASHIHVINGPGDANTADTLGPVATTTPTFVGFPTGVTSGTFFTALDTTLAGSFNPTFVTNAGSVALAEGALFTAIIEGRAYLNIHTNLFPAGEIRSFLVPTPEPSSAAAMLIGLAGLARLARRK